LAFTYDIDTDIGRVRLKVGDRRELIDPETGAATGSGIRSDEEIQKMIDDEGSWQKACIAWIQSFLSQINIEPNWTADWLEVEFHTMRDGLEKMLAEYKVWLGVAGLGNTTTTTPAWRSDSLQTEAPDDW